MATSTTKDTKDAKKEGPTTDERLDALEAAVGIGGPAVEETDAVPGEPLKPHELYAPPSEEELEAQAKQQEAATKTASA